MKKYILTILPIIMLSINAFAVAGGGLGGLTGGFLINPYLDDTSTCASENLGVSEENETSNIDPDFRPNMMAVIYDGVPITSDGYGDALQINQYDSVLRKPETVPEKQGYKFTGWKVVQTVTCGYFQSEQNCKRYPNCAWNGTECIKNPCVRCNDRETDGNGIRKQCFYEVYNSETGECDLPMAEEMATE